MTTAPRNSRPLQIGQLLGDKALEGYARSVGLAARCAGKIDERSGGHLAAARA